MKIVLLGAGGFIGTNLSISLRNHSLTLVDRRREYIKDIENLGFHDVSYIECDFSRNIDYDDLLKGQDLVYHLVSTTDPTTSNNNIVQEIESDIVFSANVLDACVRQNVKKVVFISSGGTVYGKECDCPLSEETPTYPITSYGIQKVTIEKLLYLYNYLYGLDYRVIRLSNPYGPYQRPNGKLGAVTTFIYKALKNEKISVYGDGTVVRDFIYIDDAIKGILNIADKESDFKVYNLGSGYGTSISQVLEIISETLNKDISIEYLGARKVDVPKNYLDISRYERNFGPLNAIGLEEGIIKTADFMQKYYSI